MDPKKQTADMRNVSMWHFSDTTANQRVGSKGNHNEISQPRPILCVESIGGILLLKFSFLHLKSDLRTVVADRITDNIKNRYHYRIRASIKPTLDSFYNNQRFY